MPVVDGQKERVISVRQIAHAVLRYSENTGMLRLARIRKAHQPEIAELFTSIILERPGFFDGDDAQTSTLCDRLNSRVPISHLITPTTQ